VPVWQSVFEARAGRMSKPRIRGPKADLTGKILKAFLLVPLSYFVSVRIVVVW